MALFLIVYFRLAHCANDAGERHACITLFQIVYLRFIESANDAVWRNAEMRALSPLRIKGNAETPKRRNAAARSRRVNSPLRG
jgi:hypothetical protein